MENYRDTPILSPFALHRPLVFFPTFVSLPYVASTVFNDNCPMYQPRYNSALSDYSGNFPHGQASVQKLSEKIQGKPFGGIGLNFSANSDSSPLDLQSVNPC